MRGKEWEGEDVGEGIEGFSEIDNQKRADQRDMGRAWKEGRRPGLNKFR